ncbi:hypothetical protein [Pseudodesulfovibrio pelocollis]|uniref:hypothetical protein n=1 Tax=Pseudodesulfovibrio pelocollis TaxID=3051432 RepID=UPI00255AC73F|nr:hypothetical protein [Pseudodesulfovibrio sp. SB368]
MVLMITQFTDLDTADTICELWGIPHIHHALKICDGKRDPKPLMRGSWIEVNERKTEFINTCVLPGDRIQLLPFLMSCAEIYLGSLTSERPVVTSEVAVIAMALAMHADYYCQSRGLWKEALLSIDSVGIIGGVSSQTLSSFVVRNKFWLETQFRWGKSLRSTSLSLLLRLRKDAFIC